MKAGCDQLIDIPNHIGGKEVQAVDGNWIIGAYYEKDRNC